MSKRKSGKGRSKNSISPSVSSLKMHSELEHLDGLSYIHFLDVQSNWELLNPEAAAAERIHAALLESYYFGSGGRFDLIANLWFGDSPGGISEALVMPGAAWKANVRKADDARRHWHDGTRTRTAPRGDFSGNLKKVFCRLTPWNASAAGQFLTREGTVEAVLEVAIRIEKETGLKVLGAVIHRETDHDIHVHFIVSTIGPEEIELEAYSPDYIKKLKTKQRKIIREERRERGDDFSLKAVNEDLAKRRKEGTVEDPTNLKSIVYRTLDRTKAPRRGIVCMGQQYCSKTNLWEASGRDPAVAAVQEGHSRISFRSIVQDAAAVAPDGDPAHKYFDFWLAKQWNQAVVERLPVEVRDRMPEVAKRAAQRYVEDGSSLSNPALDAAREKEDRIILEAAEAARGIRELAQKEAQKIIDEAESKKSDTQRDSDVRLAGILEREAASENLLVIAKRERDEAVALQNRVNEREKALESRELDLQVAEKDLDRRKREFDDQSRNLDDEIRELRKERDRLRRIPVADVAEKIGFRLNDQGDLTARITTANNTEIDLRIVLEDQGFKVEKYEKSADGSHVWVPKRGGKNAIDLMKAIRPDRPVKAACNHLASLFPDRKAGIVLDFLESSNPELWGEPSQQNQLQGPSVDSGSNQNQGSNSTPDVP